MSRQLSRSSSPRTDALTRARSQGSGATKAWIAIGAAWFALFLYSMTAWALGPDFTPNSFGRAAATDAYVLFIRGLEIFMVVLTVWLLFRFVLNPLFRDGKLSFDGLFFLACGTMVLQEPWLNWIRPQLLYNTIFINYGVWLGTLPGIVSPVAEKVPLSIAFAGLGYFWIVAGPAYCGSRIMGRLHDRHPDLSRTRLVLACLLGFIVFDLAIESFILRTGMFIYPSTIPALTLFAGAPHQLPLYEVLHWAGTYTFLASVHFFRNDRGETWAERGFTHLELNLAPPLKTFTRWLAIVGLCQTGMLFIYNIPYQFWALHGGPFTVTEESNPWHTAGLCGESTAYDCPGPGVPLARRESSTNRVTPFEPPHVDEVEDTTR